MANQDIADHLLKISELKKIEGTTKGGYDYYLKASNAVRNYQPRITSGAQAETIRGVGKKISKVIDDFLRTGTSDVYQKLSSKYKKPPTVISQDVLQQTKLLLEILLHGLEYEIINKVDRIILLVKSDTLKEDVLRWKLSTVVNGSIIKIAEPYPEVQINLVISAAANWGVQLFISRSPPSFVDAFNSFIQQKDYQIRDGSLVKLSTGERLVVVSEEELFTAFGLEYVNPENRP